MKVDIQNLVEEKLKEEEWQDCFLIDVETSGNKVRVFIDSDDAITFARCRKMSRYLEEVLDKNEYAGGKYVLEVSSAGTDRPLRLHRQYLKNIGRTIRFYLSDGTKKEGKLLEAQPNKVKIETIDPEDKKKKKTIQEWLDLKGVDKALVQVSFK